MVNSDFNWLPTSLLKNRDIPKIIYEPYTNQSCGGYYTHGGGIVVVENSEFEETIPDSIAHEMCHCLQWQEGRLNANHHSSFNGSNNYEQAIHNYFTQQWWEYEALLFTYKYSKNWSNEWWLKKLVHQN